MAPTLRPQQELVARLRSLLVRYLADNGELTRHGYVELPELRDMQALIVQERWDDVLEEFHDRLRDQRDTFVEAARDDATRLFARAFAGAIAKVRDDLRWEDEYARAGRTSVEEEFARSAASRLHDV
ncbi:MAG TPA: hypothetical protein VF101_14490 [Gaiellaceae bacterium]